MSDFVIVTLLESDSIVDNMISWRLESNWVHGIIQIDNDVYSSTFPVTIKVDPSFKDVAHPPRTGTSWRIPVTSEQKEKIRTYCDTRVGKKYDVLSMAGWLFRIKALQSKNLTYCFEMVYDALFAAGLVPDRNKKFISGDQLEVFVLKLNGIEMTSNAVGIKNAIKKLILLK